ncbi:hypothetical protein KSP39_PZI002012 [Platanthera zijinensis]|uniref:Gnk2-homologous domain-containing protein n=1 Tax=Platanthera zijinensis TaxID=2320716 RepID=A0AAP0C081_9ASPA
MTLSSSSSLLFPILLLLLLLPSLLLSPVTSSERSVLVTTCSGSNYTSSSSYASSLNRLLTGISMSVSQSPSLFATSISDDGSPIFALAQCRPDSTAQQCNICLQDSITTSTNSSSQGCPLRRSAALRYDYCLIRYSDQTFFGSAIDDERWSILVNTEMVSNPAEFRKRATALMSDVAAKAAAAVARFAVNESISGAPEEFIYGMAWCTMNLPSEACLLCFKQGIEALQFEQIGGQVDGIDCVLRFENLRFYERMTPRPPASEPGSNLQRNAFAAAHGGPASDLSVAPGVPAATLAAARGSGSHVRA